MLLGKREKEGETQVLAKMALCNGVEVVEEADPSDRLTLALVRHIR